MPQVQYAWPVLAPELVRRYRRTFGRWPRLRQPQTFNEKVLHRMLFDRRPVWRTFSGKLESRAYVLERTGDPGLLVDLIGTATCAADLRALDLPQHYVVKANHMSGRIRIVDGSEPVDLDELGELVQGWCRQRFRTEWGYAGVQRVAVVEPHLSPGGEPPPDHKFWCFDGRPQMVMVDVGRFGKHTRTFFDLEWRPLALRIGLPAADPLPPRPPGLTRMVEVAEALSAGLDMVRVDLYDLDGRVVFGELTSYPGAGDQWIDPPAYDLLIGQHWTLPDRRDTRRTSTPLR